MTTITVTEQGGSGRYIDLGSALQDIFNATNGGTIIVYCKPGDQTNVNYLIGRTSTAGTGMRLTVNSSELPGASPYGCSGSATAPNRTGDTAVTQGAWQHLTCTFVGNGSLDHDDDIKIYIDGVEQAQNTGLGADGSGSILSNAAYSLLLLNRNGLGRHFIGDVAYWAVWDRILDSTERATVRSSGPLAVPSGLQLCFANGQDYSSNAFAVSARTTQVAGSTPPNTALGDSGATHAATGALAGAGATTTGTATRLALHAATGVLAGAGAVVAGTATLTSTGASHAATGTLVGAGGAVSGTATRLALHAASGALAGAGAVVAGSATKTAAAVTISSPADRGTLDLPSCSVTPNGSTPTVFLSSRYAGDQNTSAARAVFARVDGVLGLTPVFDLNRANLDSIGISNGTGASLWSYTGQYDDWHPFDNNSKPTGLFRSSNNTAFTEDTVYVSRAYPWRIADSLAFITALEATGLISEPPSVVAYSGAAYEFHTRSATTNGATNGAGDVVASQPLRAFQIGTNGLAPDGLPKRKMAIISGVHAAEDIGNHIFRGLVEFLCSSDAAAVLVRSWFVIVCYPNVSAAGRAGGAQRCDFDAAGQLLDVNRQWTGTLLETIVAHKAAITTDLGATIDVLIDCHGTAVLGESRYDYVNGAGATNWEAAIQAEQPSLLVRTDLPTTAAGAWAVSSKGAHLGITAENQYHTTPDINDIYDFGADHVRAMATLIEAGEFGFSSTGALAGAGAVVAGTATRVTGTAHSSTGTLAGSGAVIAGTATHHTLHTATGVLSGIGAIVVGSAARATVHTATGALAGAGALLAGSASKPYNGAFTEADMIYLVDYLTSHGVIPTASEIAAAVLAAAAVTPIEANVKEVNDVAVTGTGVPPTYDVTMPTVLDPGDPWRPA